jgi:Ca-activated chloride channel family protein
LALACIAAVRVNRPALLLALWGAAAVAAPQQRSELPILTVRTEVVTLSVTVTDQRGAFITGLRREQFVVYDDGEPQEIQFFTSDDLPATVGLIIDSSGSMRGRRDGVIAAASAFAELRQPADEFFTLNFNDVVWSGLPPSVPFTETTEGLRAALAAVPAQGMTALYDAVARGLSHLGRGTRDRKALILVSDGGDNASITSLAAVLEQAKRSSAVIYSVTFFDPDNRDARPGVLKTFTRDTGGRAFTARTAEDVKRAFSEIAEEVRNGYSIGFAPADTSRVGFHSIRVVVDADRNRRLIARTRAGYYAGPS